MASALAAPAAEEEVEGVATGVPVLGDGKPNSVHMLSGEEQFSLNGKFPEQRFYNAQMTNPSQTYNTPYAAQFENNVPMQTNAPAPPTQIPLSNQGPYLHQNSDWGQYMQPAAQYSCCCNTSRENSPSATGAI
jgi:hypothetical protein